MSDIETNTAVYDAAAEQVIPLRVEHKGKRIKVAHRLGPLTDDLLLEYERRRNVRLRKASDSEIDEPGMEQSSDSYSAAEWLWDQLALSVSGYTPCDDWRSKVPGPHKETAINHGLLVVDIVPPVDGGADDLFDLEAVSEDNVVNMRCFFDGEEVSISHELRDPSAEQTRRYKSLMSTMTRVRGTRTGKEDIRIGAKTKQLGKLYDEIAAGATGYKDGIVPLHHKQAIALDVFGSDDEFNAKN